MDPVCCSVRNTLSHARRGWIASSEEDVCLAGLPPWSSCTCENVVCAVDRLGEADQLGQVMEALVRAFSAANDVVYFGAMGVHSLGDGWSPGRNDPSTHVNRFLISP